MPSDPETFANTHPLVTRAIHEIAETDRTAEAIHAEPNQEDYDLVAMRIRHHLENGAAGAEATGLYRWGKVAVAPYPQDAITALENANSHIFESYMLTTEYFNTAVSMVVHGLLKDHGLDPLANAAHKQIVDEIRAKVVQDVISTVAQHHPGPSRLDPATLLGDEEPDGEEAGDADPGAGDAMNVSPFPARPGPRDPGAA